MKRSSSMRLKPTCFGSASVRVPAMRFTYVASILRASGSTTYIVPMVLISKLLWRNCRFSTLTTGSSTKNTLIRNGRTMRRGCERMRAPNPRVQRTRHPLGRHIAALLRVACGSSLLVSSCTSAGGQVRQPPDLGGGGMESLSGEWRGSLRERKTGSCTIGWRTDKRFQGSELTHKVKAEAVVSADGSFSIREFLDDASEPAAWTGAIDASFRVNAVMTSQAVCRGEEHENHIRVAGTLFRESNHLRLELFGNDDRCPKLGCSFSLTYELTKLK